MQLENDTYRKENFRRVFTLSYIISNKRRRDESGEKVNMIWMN